MMLVVFLLFFLFLLIVGGCCRNVVGVAVSFRGEADVAVVKADAARAEDGVTLRHNEVLHVGEFAATLTRLLFVHIFPGEIFRQSKIDWPPRRFSR